LAQESTGPLIAASAFDDEHDEEVQVARGALDGGAVVESSALLLLGQLEDSENLSGRLSFVYATAATRRDILRATSDIRDLSASPGTIGWDPRAESIYFAEMSAEQYSRYARRVSATYSQVQATITKTVSNITVMPNWDHILGDSSWLDALQLANDMDLPLWADDLGLRRLARGLGIRAFGTPALAEAIADENLGPDPSGEDIRQCVETRSAWVGQFLRCQVVDVPAHLDDVLKQIEEDGGMPLAGALAISRASWWAWQPNPLADLLRIYALVSKLNPAVRPDWQYAAMLGAGRTYVEKSAGAATVAAIALLGYSEAPEPGVVLDGCRRARVVAEQLKLPDPVMLVPTAARALHRAGRALDAEEVTRLVLDAFPPPDSADDARPESATPATDS
jgi:hypothetical protein